MNFGEVDVVPVRHMNGATRILRQGDCVVDRVSRHDRTGGDRLGPIGAVVPKRYDAVMEIDSVGPAARTAMHGVITVDPKMDEITGMHGVIAHKMDKIIATVQCVTAQT